MKCFKSWVVLSFFTLCFLARAQETEGEKNYLSVRKVLSEEYCSDKILQAEYAPEIGAKYGETLKVDFNCPKKMFFNWSIGLKFLFFYNGSEAWVVYEPDGDKIGKLSNVERYMNPHARWLSPWLSLYQPFNMVDDKVRESAEVFSQGYDLNLEKMMDDKIQIKLKPKEMTLPTIFLNYAANDKMPESIMIGLLQKNFSLVRKSLKEIEVKDVYHFSPDISPSSNVKVFTD